MARTAATLVLITATLTGCGSTARAPATHTGRRATIQISGYAFHPDKLTSPTGSQVKFINHDSTAHTATETSQPAAFDTGTLKPGQSKTITLRTAGTYTYYCQFHAFMRATIVVSRPGS